MGPGSDMAFAHASALGRRIRSLLPTGHSVSIESWNRRHRAITNLLWAHVLVVPIYGVLQGERLSHALLEGFVVAALAIGASSRALKPLNRSVMATLGLVSASAILTHFSGGLI